MAEVYCGSPRKQVVLKPYICLDLGGEGERSEACGKTGPTRNECRGTGCVGEQALSGSSRAGRPEEGPLWSHTVIVVRGSHQNE